MYWPAYFFTYYDYSIMYVPHSINKGSGIDPLRFCLLNSIPHRIRQYMQYR